MHKIYSAISYFLIAPSLIFSSYSSSEKSRMIADLDIIKNEFEIYYAPMEWKKNRLNWNLYHEITNAQEKILSASDLMPRQYQQIVRDLFNSAQDLHVGVNFFSTEFAFLPFVVQGVDNRYFVVDLDKDWADTYGVPLQSGDEILAFDGKPVDEIIREIQLSAYGSCNNETFCHLSELLLTLREGNALQNVPQGTIEVSYKKRNQEKRDFFLVEWIYMPEQIESAFLKQRFFEGSKALGQHSFFHKIRALPLYDKWKQHKLHGCFLMGSKKNPFPSFGVPIWKSNSKAFHAYIYSLKGRKIGYIHIPDFYDDAAAIEEFRKIIAIMEGRTQALVIDVMNNPGGLVFYTYAIASMLTDKPLQNLKEAMTITQEDVFFAVQDSELLEQVNSDRDAQDILGKNICGYPVDKKIALGILNFAQFIKDQFKQGKFITDPFPLEGVEYIWPHSTTRYTKPILVLANNLSISCGDFLPALLQDNKRAKVLGCQTAGAGGYVLKRKYSNRFGVADFTLTGSLMYRLNGKPLEDLGVMPDYPYSFSIRDYTKNYEDFVEFVNTVLIDIK